MTLDERIAEAVPCTCRPVEGKHRWWCYAARQENVRALVEDETAHLLSQLKAVDTELGLENDDQDRAATLRRIMAEKEAADTKVATFVQQILHGDDEHQAWLTKAGRDFVAGRPVDRPAGKGNRERAEAAEAENTKLREALEVVKEQCDSDDTLGAWKTADETLRALADQCPVCGDGKGWVPADSFDDMGLGAMGIVAEKPCPEQDCPHKERGNGE